MLRTLKWVYDLGVKQERTRIASQLQVATQRAMASMVTRQQMLEELPLKAKERRDRLQFANAVDDRVKQIVDSIFQDEGGHWVPGRSIMFPEEEKK